MANEYLNAMVLAAADQLTLGVEITLTTPDVSMLFQRVIKAGFLVELYTPLS